MTIMVCVMCLFAKCTGNKQVELLMLFVCLFSMKYPVMRKRQQMMFTSQYQQLTVICSLLLFQRSWIWLGKRSSTLCFAWYTADQRAV